MTHWKIIHRMLGIQHILEHKSRALGTSSRYGRDEIAAFQKGLMRGGERIFNDIAWQHYAYMRSGYPALEYVNRKSRLAITDEVLLGWKFTERAESHLRVRSLPTAEVDQLLVEAGRRIADYEQNIVISPVYRDLEQILFGQIVELMTTLAPAPVPGGASFDSLMPAGARLSDDVSRWAWITAGLPGAQIQGAGVIHTWSNHGFGAKNDLVKKNLAKGGREFSRVYQAGNLVSIQVWDHHDGEHQ